MVMWTDLAVLNTSKCSPDSAPIVGTEVCSSASLPESPMGDSSGWQFGGSVEPLVGLAKALGLP